MASDTYIALAVSLPKPFFPDGDDACWVAGREICSRLERYLVPIGHLIPQSHRGGIIEEWGLTFESRCGGEEYSYDIFYLECPNYTLDDQLKMVIRYHPKPLLRAEYKWWQWWFAKPRFEWLAAEHPLYHAMRAFGQTFDWSKMMTRAELNEIEGVEYA